MSLWRQYVHGCALWFLTRPMPGPRTFSFGGREFPYFNHRYNFTPFNERRVEIPLARAFLAGADAKDVLEVGNVMAHYDTVRHLVIDKYETAAGVENADAVNYAPGRRFSRILSISTLEHVGWDESPREPEKVDRAVRNLAGLLDDTGEFLFTVPIGYNAWIDGALRDRRWPEAWFTYLLRIHARGEWREATREEALRQAFGRPYPFANAIAVGRLTRGSVGG